MIAIFKGGKIHYPAVDSAIHASLRATVDTGLML